MDSSSLCSLLFVSVAAFAVTVGVYLSWPCPPASSKLREWKAEDASYFTANQRKIFYKDIAGEGKLVPGGTLLLLHGFPTMSYDWIKVLPSLKGAFRRVIAVDFLGFGFSDKPKGYNYTLVEQADLVSALLRALTVSKVHVLSHDYGDSVAQELLARYNEGAALQIESACLLNGGMFKETNFPMALQRLLTFHQVTGKIFSGISNRYLFSRGLSKTFGDNKPADENLYDFWCGYCYQQGYQNSADILGYIAERGRNNMRWREALSQSRAPIHVIYGPADPVNPPPFISFYKKVVPEGTIDVLADNIGHYPQWEDPDNVAKLYLQFIQSRVLKQQ